MATPYIAFQDSFSGTVLNSAYWNDGFGAPNSVVSGGIYSMTVRNGTGDANEVYVTSLSHYDFSSASISAKVVTPPPSPGYHTQFAPIGLYTNNNNQLYIQIDGFTGNLIAVILDGGVENDSGGITYSIVIHRYLRVRIPSGDTKIYFDYSADGISWANFWSVTKPSFLADSRILLSMYSSEAIDHTCSMDDFNIVPSQNLHNVIGNPKIQGYLDNGRLPAADDGSIDSASVAWSRLQVKMQESVNAGQLFSRGIVSTYSLVRTTTSECHCGGVLAPNGDVHFLPYNSHVGQKVDIAGLVSTYSLVATAPGYQGGVLASNGDIHFIPTVSSTALVGQKLAPSGLISTYSLVNTGTATLLYLYSGGVLSPNGDIHLIPYTNVDRGQKISSSGVVSTYSLVYTNTTTAYWGGVLAPNGDINFVPMKAVVGQKISAAGVVSTYSLAYTSTTTTAHIGGVLAVNGDTHFVPFSAVVGQKISSTGVISTYSLVYTAGGAYAGGVLTPNGDIHFVPYNATVGQKISALGIVSTYSLSYTVSNAYIGGVLTFNGDIHFSPCLAVYGQKISTNPCKPFSQAMCLSPFLNKF